MKDIDSAQPPTLDLIHHGSRSELQALYKEIFERPPPKRASLDFLRGNLAWAIQALRLNKDPATLRTHLIKQTTRSDTPHKFRYKPGTRLIREWQGQTHEVTILDKGYRWQGEHYRSLSRIAQEITGTKWSGPRFFGMAKSDNE